VRGRRRRENERGGGNYRNKRRSGHVRPFLSDADEAGERASGQPGASAGKIRHLAVREIDTPHGTARAYLYPAEDPLGLLVLGHGAAGGVQAPDLVAATDAARAENFSVALVEQPYRVAGRRSPAGALQLDAAWIAVVERLRESELADLPLVVGGRSLGARVACRTVEATGADGVLCLAFPLEPPRRAGKPRQSRLDELDAVTVPTLVVQGESDPFGMPPPGPTRQVAKVPGNHGLKADPEAVGAAVRAWLPGVVVSAAAPAT
jgi:predicted alpha/beta-hydrolase family hydrolase